MKRNEALVRLWARVVEPKTITIFMAVAYIIMFLVGVSFLVDRTLLVGPLIGTHTETLMGSCLIIGGTFGVFSCPPGWWWLERVALILVGTAVAVYSMSNWALHFRGVTGNQVIPAGLSTVVVIFVITRWLRIRYARINPRK